MLVLQNSPSNSWSSLRCVYTVQSEWSTRMNQPDWLCCWIQFLFTHIHNVESVHFKMVQTEVICAGVVMISEVLSENLHGLLKKKKMKRKSHWWVKNCVTPFIRGIINHTERMADRRCGNVQKPFENVQWAIHISTGESNAIHKEARHSDVKKYLTLCKTANYTDILSCRRLFWYIRGHIPCTQMHNILIPTWRFECYIQSSWRFHKGKNYIRIICVIYYRNIY